MNIRTGTVLAEINRAFYTSFAGDFARTRRTWPPGFDSILPYLEAANNIVDLGCGNGRLLAFLAEHGWRGRYLGVDGAPALLAIAAREAARVEGATATFEEVDLLAPDWERIVATGLSASDAAATLPAGPGLGNLPSRALACLAVLHHVPGADQRAAFLAACVRLLRPGGVLVLSTWQFLASPRLRSRILPWSAVGLSDADVEPGDYLLSWGQGAAGRRYCAAIDAAALAGLAADAGLELVRTWVADGLEGNLNLYGVCRRPTT